MSLLVGLVVLVDELGVFPLSDIIPPWFPILIYHLGDEQYTHW
jgi:hypothetical protein